MIVLMENVYFKCEERDIYVINSDGVTAVNTRKLKKEILTLKSKFYNNIFYFLLPVEKILYTMLKYTRT